MDPIKTEIVIVGAGPGGYAAAFYAADLGKKVILVEREKRLGGVCLNRGCIPSKALLHATSLIHEAKESAHRGISFASPTIDLEKLRTWKESILEKLAQGINFLAQKRGVQVMHGRGYFEDSRMLRVETEAGQKFITYEQAIANSQQQNGRLALAGKSGILRVDTGDPTFPNPGTPTVLVEGPPRVVAVVGTSLSDGFVLTVVPEPSLVFLSLLALSWLVLRCRRLK